MELIGICQNCKKHTIVSATNSTTGTINAKQSNTHRNTKSATPKYKQAKCVRCGAIGRITIIGTLLPPMSAINEYDAECGTTNTLHLKFWNTP